MNHSLVRRPTWFFVLLGACLGASPSFASDNYPGTLKVALKLKSVPVCTLCHTSNLGGDGTVVTKFGKNIKARGAAGNSDTKSLLKALTSEQATPVDSDGDSVFDLDELLDGSDPNVVDREAPPPDPDPVSEGGSPGASSGTGGSSGGTPGSGGSTSSGGTPGSEPTAGVGAAADGGAISAHLDPEPPGLDAPEFPTLATGCALGGPRSPGGLFAALAALALVRLRRSRRSAHK